MNRSQPCYAVAKKCKHRKTETEAQARRQSPVVGWRW